MATLNYCLWLHSDSLQKLIQKTMVKWAEDTFITSPDLVREMFSLLHRQYNGIGEVSYLTATVFTHYSIVAIGMSCIERNCSTHKVLHSLWMLQNYHSLVYVFIA